MGDVNSSSHESNLQNNRLHHGANRENEQQVRKQNHCHQAEHKSPPKKNFDESYPKQWNDDCGREDKKARSTRKRGNAKRREGSWEGSCCCHQGKFGGKGNSTSER